MGSQPLTALTPPTYRPGMTKVEGRVQVNVWLSEAQHAELKARAGQLSIAAYLRRLLFEELPRIEQDAELFSGRLGAVEDRVRELEGWRREVSGDY